MTKPKNKWRLIVVSIIALISLFILAILSFSLFLVWGFNRRKDVTYKECGNQTYVIFTDYEGARIMHNTNNEKMNQAGGDIITRYEALDITTTLGIENKQEKDAYIGFFPENNKLEDWELDNLIECYSDSEMVLLTNIRNVQVKPGFIEQQSDEEKLR